MLPAGPSTRPHGPAVCRGRDRPRPCRPHRWQQESRRVQCARRLTAACFVTDSSDEVVHAKGGKGAFRLTWHPAFSQGMPTDQRTSQREKGLVDVRTLIVPELRFHGESYGWEGQFLVDDGFSFYARGGLVTRALAVQ